MINRIEPAVAPTPLQNAVRAAKKLKKDVELVSKLAGTARAVTAVLPGVSPEASQRVAATKLIALPAGILEIPELCANYQELTRARSDGAVVRAGAKVAKSLGAITDSAAGTIAGLKAAGAVSKQAGKGAGLIGLPAALFAVPQLAVSAHAFVTAEDQETSIKAGAAAADSIGTIMESTGNTIQGLSAVTTVSSGALQAVAPLGIVALPFNVIALGSNIYDLYKDGKNQHQMNQVSGPSHEQTLETRRARVRQALAPLEQQSAGELQERFDLDKTEKVKGAVSHTLEQMRENVPAADREKEIIKGEKLVKELKSRTKTKLTLSVFTTALKIFSIVAAVLAIAVPPLGIPMLIAAAAASLIGLGVYLYKRFGLSKKLQGFMPEAA
jgi:hypothetical protein